MKSTAELCCLRLFLIPFSAFALTLGCGEGNVLRSPTGPSSTLSSATFLTGEGIDRVTVASSASEAEVLAKGGNGNGHEGDDKNSAENDGPGRSHEAKVVGFVTARSGDTLTVKGVSVVAGDGAIIRHGNRTLTIGDIDVGDHVQARGTMDGTTLVATEIKVEDTGNDDDDDFDEAEVEGQISDLSSTSNCPVVTFMIGTTKITTSAATTFDDVSCSNLASNARVEVEGTKQADGSILAAKVEAEAGPDEVVGTVFEFSGSGSCPSATFKVGPTLNLATKVTTSGSTTFSGVTCGALANGARVEVEGTKQGDGSITAASVELK